MVLVGEGGLEVVVGLVGLAGVTLAAVEVGVGDGLKLGVPVSLEGGEFVGEAVVDLFVFVLKASDEAGGLVDVGLLRGEGGGGLGDAGDGLEAERGEGVLGLFRRIDGGSTLEFLGGVFRGARRSRA